MNRHEIIDRIGKKYLTSNMEPGEYSYVLAAGSRAKLEKLVGHKVSHFKLDIRFEYEDIVILVEHKKNFVKSDEKQLQDYLEEEKAVHGTNKCICILANKNNDKIKVWKTFVDDEHVLNEEKVLDSAEHYANIFSISKINDREKVLKNTYELNELLHKMDIDESKRSQFVGTTLLYIKDQVSKHANGKIDEVLENELKKNWSSMNSSAIRGAISGVLSDLLDGSKNKTKKIALLQQNVLNDQKVQRLNTADWVTVLDTILMKIYRYINVNTQEGQDILNLFFIAFNKYTGKADKNQAFTPDHITDFMCRITDVNRDKVVMDITCGSGSFLVQAMVQELADCDRKTTEKEAKKLRDIVKKSHIFGIENEEKAYGLATTNMLIHGDGNSNIQFDSCFECKDFIEGADPDIILMNPPYNAKPKSIPECYKTEWGKAKDGKEDPTKGMVFIHYLSDVVKDMNKKRVEKGFRPKTVKLAVLLPVSAAIGTSSIISAEKANMLEENTLEAVFTLPNEVFYPGSSVSTCCMVFTLGKPHVNSDGTVNETFFGYYKEDGFKKKKNLGRVEQFNQDGSSKWKTIREEWLNLFRNKKAVDGLSATAIVRGNDEWLCEAYMKTDYSKLSQADFQQTLNNYLSYLMKEGKIYES